MAVLNLTCTDIGTRHHRRTANLIREAQGTPDHLLPDWKPPDRNCLTLETAQRGMWVKELISPHRPSGQIVGFKKCFPYPMPLPVVQWHQGREPWMCCKAVAHPAILEQIDPPSGDPAEPELPDGVEWQQLKLF